MVLVPASLTIGAPNKEKLIVRAATGAVPKPKGQHVFVCVATDYHLSEAIT